MATFDQVYERVFVEGFYDYHGTQQGCLTYQQFVDYSNDYVIDLAEREVGVSQTPDIDLVNDLARRYIRYDDPHGSGGCGAPEEGGGDTPPAGGDTPPAGGGGTPGGEGIVIYPSKTSGDTPWGTILLVGGAMAAAWYYLKGQK